MDHQNELRQEPLQVQRSEKAVNQTAPNQFVPETSRRWASEAEFFDKLGEAIEPGLRPFSHAQLARYLESPRRIYDKEFRFRLLGDLHGQRVLDVGCGEGSNSVLLARAGAQVEGVDLSPKLIELAHKRAAMNGVSQQVRFQCAPIEKVQYEPGSFDVIWGDGVLHHLIDVLQPTLEQLTRWAKPGALFLFSEPVNLNPLLRRLRLKVPIHTDATPDERPLEARELELVRRFLPDLRMRHFHFLSRFTRFVVPLHDYEHAPLRQRALADAIHAVDFGALGFERLQSLGGMAVMWARLR